MLVEWENESLDEISEIVALSGDKDLVSKLMTGKNSLEAITAYDDQGYIIDRWSNILFTNTKTRKARKIEIENDFRKYLHGRTDNSDKSRS